MILIIWPSEKAKDCAHYIEHALQEPALIASSLHEGCERLRSGEYSAVVVDQWITEAEPEPTSVLFDHLGMAVPLFVNFGISGMERIVRELRALSPGAGWKQFWRATVRGRRSATNLRTMSRRCCFPAVMEEPSLTEDTRARLGKIEEVAKHIKHKLALSENENVTATSA
jgi:hypothetical protein